MTAYLRATDSAGEHLDLISYEDLLVPAQMFKNEFTEKLAILKSFEHKEGDVIICSYPKTGTNWMGNLVHFISRPNSIESEATIQVVFMEISPIPVAASLTSPRVVTTHLRYDRLPKHYMNKNGKIILVLRNPKDVMVSLYHMLRKLQIYNMDSHISWDAFVTCFLNGLVPFKSYFDFLDDWQTTVQEHPNQILVVYYEDLKKKCMSEVKRIQEYLGYNNDDACLNRIIDKCCFDSLRSDVEAGKVETKLITEEGKAVVYRKGEIGDWKNHLTVAQNELFDKIIEKRLKNSMFKFVYEWTKLQLKNTIYAYYYMYAILTHGMFKCKCELKSSWTMKIVYIVIIISSYEKHIQYTL